MARYKTVRRLLEERGPFEAKTVRPDLDVLVVRLEPGGVVAEADILGERDRGVLVLHQRCL